MDDGYETMAKEGRKKMKTQPALDMEEVRAIIKKEREFDPMDPHFQHWLTGMELDGTLKRNGHTKEQLIDASVKGHTLVAVVFEAIEKQLLIEPMDHIAFCAFLETLIKQLHIAPRNNGTVVTYHNVIVTSLNAVQEVIRNQMNNPFSGILSLFEQMARGQRDFD